MEYLYLKAVHIVFVVTWFAGLFYMPRLFIYFTEAAHREEAGRQVLQEQFLLMMKRLWLGITWPSALITLVIGLVVLFNGNWDDALAAGSAGWLWIKLVFVLLLYVYHFSLHIIYRKLVAGHLPYSSNQLRIWNEVATVFLIAIVMLATVKQSISLLWGLAGLILLIVLLLAAIRIYRHLREGR